MVLSEANWFEMRFSILVGVLFCLGGELLLPLMGQIVSSQPIRTDQSQQQATIDRALVDLQSGNPEIRKGAVMLLGKYEATEAKNGVLGALSDMDGAVRFAAVVSVLERRSFDSVTEVEAVMHALDDTEVDIRRSVSTSIGRLAGTRSQILNRQSILVNRGLVGQSLMLPIPIQLKIVNAFLDTDVVVRRNMISRYNYLGINIPQEIFVRLLQDEDLEVRSLVLPLAARHLEFPLFVEKAAVVADDESPILRLSLIRELYPRSALKPIQLLEKLTQDSDPEVATSAELQLFNNAPHLQLYKALVERFNRGELNANQSERLVQLVERLMETEERDRFLLQFLESPDEAVRVAAVRHFFQLGLVESHPDKSVAVLEDPSSNVRSQAVSYYRRYRDKVPSPDWGVWLESEFKDVRLALVRLATGLPREEAGELLFDLLLDDEIDVRAEALTMYSLLRLDGFEKMLEMTLGDESVVIQKRAVQNILQLMGEPGRALLEDYVKDEGAATPLSVFINSQLKVPK